LIGQAFSSGETSNIDDVRKQKGYFMAVVETESELIVPIKFKGNTIGVFNSESENKGYYDKNMIDTIENLANDFGLILKDYGWHPGIEVS
jgi:putative methionine-R-sulfoxide reductase with GAF domain